MNKNYIALIVAFGLLLLLPFGVQSMVDLRGEKRFLCFDIFKDVVYTPFKRGLSISVAADSVNVHWRMARESIAAGGNIQDALEPVMGAVSDLESVVFSVNSFAQLDSLDLRFKLLKQADSLLVTLEDEPESFPQVDSCLKTVVAEFSGFSIVNAFLDVKHYGVWTSHYLRAFEQKVENENALVLAVRPKYQWVVWNVFNDPGEKVVLGNKQIAAGMHKDSMDRWLYYRQDVDFLVQPSPLDARSAKLDNPIQAIIKFRDQLKAKGMELLVVVVPGKPSIYPERLVLNEDLSSSVNKLPAFGHGKKILDSLTALGLNTVNLYEPLWHAKVDDEKFGALYLNDDTHWTPRGAELVAHVISAKVHEMVTAGLIDIGLESMDYVVHDSIANRMGDIGEMSGLNKFDVFKAQQVVGHVVYQQTIEQRNKPQDSLSKNEVIENLDEVVSDAVEQDIVFYDTTRTPFRDDFRKSKILILGDSFSRIYQTDAPVNAGWIAHFAYEMKRPVSSIVSDGGASTLVREKLARKAQVLKGKKLLIWEFVERDLRFGAEGWKTVELN